MRVGASAAIVACTVASTAAASGDVALPVELRPLLAAYCVDCHDGPRAKGGLDLVPALERGAIAEEPLRALRRRLAKGDMPPADEPERPSRDESRAAVAAIDALVPPARREVPAVRRLNRAQYERAVRDILGEVDLAAIAAIAALPRDEVGEGFDTTGDTLAMPPLVVEKYLDAAEALAACAVLPASLERRTVHAPEALVRAGAGYAGDGVAWLATNGTLAARHDVRHAGRHRVEIALCGQQAGPDPVRVAVLVDGAEIARREVPETREAPGFLAWEGDLASGPREIAVRFLNDWYDAKEPDASKRDRNLGVATIVVTGPIGPVPETWFEREAAAVAGSGSPVARLRRIAAWLGERAFRRPLADDEVDGLVRVARDAAGAEAGDDEQLRALTTLVLVDPRFFLRVEPPAAAGTSRALDGHELASRLSFFLWSSIPDDVLREAASAGDLDSAAGIVREVRRMLADPRAQALSQRFAAQWLGIEDLESREFDPAVYPAVERALLVSMRRETEFLFDEVATGALPLRALLESRTTRVDRALARHYGVAYPDETGVGDGFRRVRMPDARAGGVLGHASVLVATSNPTRTSPVKRGKWVLEALLDAAPPPPPPGVPQLPETAEEKRGLSMRALMELHRANPDCASCHVRMDAIGLAFERFDADGRIRETVDGAPVDDRTVLSDGREMVGAHGVASLLAADDAFERSVARRLLVFALGRGTADADDALLDALAARARARGSMPDLIEAIATSDAFRSRRD